MKAHFFILITVILCMGLIQVRLHPAEENIKKAAEETGEVGEKLDLFLVLDNSGSMKTNDPKFLTRTVVTNFLKQIEEHNRLGMVIFDETAVLAQPLTRVADDNAREKFLKTLEKVNYKGQWTNSPDAIERALYELKTNGRKDAEKIIIFLTDGIVDTGNKSRDSEKLSWLKEELARDSKNSGVRIFGIAFTDKADFSLIQTLALKTEGQYYRAFNAEDIQGIFIKIGEAIKKLKAGKQLKPEEVQVRAPAPAKQEPVSPPPPAKKEGLPLPLPVILGGGFILLLVIILLLTRKKSKGAALVSADADMPLAELLDEQGVISKDRIEINKSTVTIGRDPNTDITIPKETVSALHATIKYQDNVFFLEDQRSSNFTRLNNKKIPANQPIALKSGDRITFDIYKFQFILPQMTPAGGTVLKQSISKETDGISLRKPEPPEQPTIPKPKPRAEQEPPEQPTIPKPKPRAEQEPPEQPTIPKPKPGVKAQPPERQTIPKPKPNIPEDKTEVKPGMCPNHPDRKATTLCTICRRPFCAECIYQLNGNDVCVNCTVV
jgi:pSer/pThr/pTyr-binding forkhead associated (FHA) protein/Mg-chelatase subunit ChlD